MQTCRRRRPLNAKRDLDAFDLTQETQAVRDAYGRDNFGQGVLLAKGW